MGSGLLGVAVSGLQAAQIGLQVTEHNIANANTPGYSRQSIRQTTASPQYLGAGFIGRGAVVSTVERHMDSVLNRQANRVQSNVSALESFTSQIVQIDNMLADPSAGLSPALQEFFSGLQVAAANPASLPARQTMVSAAQSLVARFHTLESQLADQYDNVNNKLSSTIDQINAFADNIADINQRIMQTEGAVTQPANDLRDQRDQMVAELSKLIDVSSVIQDGSSINIYVGNGQQLVVGTNANHFQILAASADSSRLAVAMPVPGGALELQDSAITGGSLGGLLRYREESLDRAANALGQVAASLALTFNAQNALGQDLLGNAAGASNFVGDFFRMSQPQVIANANNSGSATIAATFSDPSTRAHYTLERDAAGTTYTLTRLGDNQTWTGTDISDATGAAAFAELAAQVLADEDFTLSLPSALTAGSSIEVTAPGVADANFFTKLTGSDYRLNFASGGAWTLTRLADDKTVRSGSGAESFSIDGLDFDISAGAQPGDSFLIQPTREAARNIEVDARIKGDVRLLAAAAPVRGKTLLTNSGSAAIEVTRVGPGVPSAGFQLPITLAYDSATASLSGFPAGASISVTRSGESENYQGAATVPIENGDTITVNGISFKLVGALADGDRFTLEANVGGTSDSRNLVLLGKLQTQQTMADKSATFQSAYGKMVSDIGNQTHSGQVDLEAQAAMSAQIESSREAIRGVNLDEEAAEMLRYQQAYQASAKIFDISTRLFDILYQLGG